MENEIIKLKNQTYGGFRLLETSETLFQEHQGHLTDQIALHIIDLCATSLKTLLAYPYFAAKVYRLMGEIYEEKGDIEKAIENYSLAFKHNSKVGVKKKLQTLDPTNNSWKSSEKKPPFQINNPVHNSLTYLTKVKSCSAGQAPRGSYYLVLHSDHDCVYIKNHYKNSDLLLGEASISFTTNYGLFLDQRHFNHLVYKYSWSSLQGRLASISFDLKLYLYFPDNRPPIMRDISENVWRRDQIRCLVLSTTDEKIYYSKGGSLFTLDKRLEIINEWKSKIDRTRVSVPKQYPHKPLSILGLTGSPNNEEIKAAYHRRLFEVHPDLNPDNPKANEETREVINAFENLTSGDYFSENSMYHVNITQSFSVYFPAFEDEICSIYILDNNAGIYIGYFSGKVILLKSDGSYEQIFRSNTAIRDIREIGGFQYFVSDQIDILTNHKVKKTIINIDGFSRIIWSNNAFVIINGQILRLYSLDGTMVGEIEFRDKIVDVYVHQGHMKVATATWFYEYKIEATEDSIYLQDTIDH